jgi:hypothetical protein
MDLLSDIQGAAVDPGHSLSDLLRKCQILAFRLRHEPFKNWVGHELNGYLNDGSLPPYRGSMRGQLRANLSGPFGRSAPNVQVPVSLFPKEMRGQVTDFDFYQPVAVLENMVASAKEGNHPTLQSPFPVEMFARMEIMQGYETVGMWLEVPVSSIVGVLDQVRSRALTFSLEIEAENPAAGESKREDTKSAEPPVPLARIDAIFNTVILGGAVAIGPNASVEVNVQSGDLDSLMRYLEEHFIGQVDRDELAEAIKGDAAEGKPKDGPGTRVAAWLGKISLKVAASGGRISEGTAAGVIAAGVARYLGLM